MSCIFCSYFPFFFVCSDSDIGDKYSVFRQLEQPADKKPVGKNLSQPFLYIKVSEKHTCILANLLFFFIYFCVFLSQIPLVSLPNDKKDLLGSEMMPVSTWLKDRRDLQEPYYILLRKQVFVLFWLGFVGKRVTLVLGSL